MRGTAPIDATVRHRCGTETTTAVSLPAVHLPGTEAHADTRRHARRTRPHHTSVRGSRGPAEALTRPGRVLDAPPPLRAAVHVVPPRADLSGWAWDLLAELGGSDARTRARRQVSLGCVGAAGCADGRRGLRLPEMAVVVGLFPHDRDAAATVTSEDSARDRFLAAMEAFV